MMNIKVAPTNIRFIKTKIIGLLVLLLILAVSVLPVKAIPISLVANSAQSLAAVTTSFVAVNDSYVDSSSPTANYGSLTTLRGDGSPFVRSYLRFNIQGLTGAVTQATLRIYANSSSNGGYNIQSVSDNTWVESTINYNNAPAIGSILGSYGAFSSGVWTSVDVTAYITGNGTYNLALTVPGVTAISFASRESGANAPQLVVVSASGSLATSTATPLPLATSTSIPAPLATSTATPLPLATATATAAASGNLVTFIPVADAYVNSGNPSSNYGSLTTLRGDGSPFVNSYLRFNVQGLSAAVTQATLRIFANSTSDSGGYAIHSVSDNTWVELAITYNNAPPMGSILGKSPAFSSGVWTSVDVTAYITGNGTYSLALSVPDVTAISFASRESGANAPQLVVKTGSGSLPTSTALPAPTNTPTTAPVNTPLPAPTNTAAPAPTNTATPGLINTATPTASASVVLVGAGDISSCGNNNDEATALLLDGIPGTVFTTGDNAYDSGSITDYTNCYDPTWGRLKARTNPVPGNHDYNTAGAAGYFQYFNAIAPYYAYNLGSWRVYALNSEISVSATSAQVTWLQNDLAAHPNLCVMAYWHEPRWSSGSTHGSNTGMQTLWQVLYNAGADLIINGHEHNYERFAEMNAAGSAASPGMREFVVGTGGTGHYPFGTPLSTSQVRNDTTFGVLKLTLSAGAYSWQFVPVAGSTFTDSGSSNCR